MFRKNQKPRYRKKSLARLSSPERLDEMMKVINPKSWLILIAFVSVIIAGIVWGIFGHIPIAIEVKGQSVNGAIELIDSPEPGRLKELKVNRGDIVKKGQVLAIIETTNRGISQDKIIPSKLSGRVLSIAPLGIQINSKTHFAIIEKMDSSQKSIFCLSSLSECQKIKPQMQVEVIAGELSEQFEAKVQEVLPLIASPLKTFENNVNLSEKPAVTNNLIPQTESGVIQILGNLQINNIAEDKLQEYLSYPVSIRVIEKRSPISFMLPKLGLNNGTK